MAALVSIVSWVYASAGEVDFVATHTSRALEIVRDAGDLASQARCFYGLAVVSSGDSAMFEPVYELAAAAGNRRFAVYGALLAAGSLLGTEQATARLQRINALAVDFDDDTFQLILPGWAAHHAALRGDQDRAGALARQALRYESRAIAAEFTVAGCVMLVAVQGNDAELLQLAAQHIPPELRDVPGSEWWVQLLDNAATLLDPDRLISTFAVPAPHMLVLLVSDLVVRVLLSDGRLDDARQWLEQVPPTWPSAHSSATLARAWIGQTGAEPAAADQIHDARTEAATLGLGPFMTESIELLALHLTDSGHHDHSARLLGAAQAARDRMGIRWRYPYHQAGVNDARQRARDTLGHQTFDALYDEGTQSSLDDAVLFAQRMRGKRARPNHGWAALTPTEIAVAREIATGFTNQQTAEKLFMAHSTVKTHLERIYAKLGVHTRAAFANEVTQHATP